MRIVNFCFKKYSPRKIASKCVCTGNHLNCENDSKFTQLIEKYVNSIPEIGMKHF